MQTPSACRLCAGEAVPASCAASYAGALAPPAGESVARAEAAGTVAPFCTFACAHCGRVAAFSYTFHCAARARPYATADACYVALASRISAAAAHSAAPSTAR